MRPACGTARKRKHKLKVRKDGIAVCRCPAETGPPAEWIRLAEGERSGGAFGLGFLVGSLVAFVLR